VSTILLDCDGVLADFVTPALRIVAEVGGGPVLMHDDLTTWDIEDALAEDKRPAFWERVCAEGFCSSLLPYPGVKEALAELRGIGTVVCVTSPMATSRTWQHERLHWLKDVLGFERDHVISTSGKSHVAGSYFADDKPEHVEAWRKASGGVGFVIARPYNTGAKSALYRAPRRGSLEQFVAMVREPKAMDRAAE
jgi:5'(3')-deoxyribonucleotidase